MAMSRSMVSRLLFLLTGKTMFFYLCILSIIVGAGIGLLGVWVPSLAESDFFWKSLLTTGILFAASALGSIVTKLLT